MKIAWIDPSTGEFSHMKHSGYSPTALLYLDFVKRLDDASRGHIAI